MLQIYDAIYKTYRVVGSQCARFWVSVEDLFDGRLAEGGGARVLFFG